MKNILYLANKGNLIGGGEVSLKELLKGLNKETFCPLVICPEEGELAKGIRRMGLRVFCLPMKRLRYGNLLSLFSTVARMAKIIKREKVDLIHANGSRCMIYGGIAARLCRKPIVWHVRIAQSEPMLDKFLASLASRVVVISQAVKKRRFNWLKKKEKVEVVYNGADLELYNAKPNNGNLRKELGLSETTPLVGVVAQLHPKKGLQFFLKAARQVNQLLADCRFLIVGEDITAKEDYLPQLRALTRELGIEGRVVYTGYREDIPSVMASIDCLVLSSLEEAFGRVLIEAMAASVPVVATEVGGVPEIVVEGRTGLLVPPADEESLARGIIYLLQNREVARKMGQKGRARVEKLFSLEGHVARIEALYNQLLNQRER